MKFFVLIALFTFLAEGALGQITKPDDAPKPLPPSESVKSVKLPSGFRLELVAVEPLIRQPSGVCWDEHGRLFVCELHGYNREGQYDIEALNKTGKLDRVVRRIPANEEAIRRAEKEQYGTVKRLIDVDGDGRMDKAEVWADDLPACFGICPALGGIIVVCSPDIVFLADRDRDGRAEVRETLFTGFKPVIIERRMNSPQWGPDNWIYIDGGRGGHITGPNLPFPVDLAVTGFRIKPDGSAIEPVSGHTGTYGFTFTAAGDRLVISTGTPGIQVAPLPWRYLSRNPDVAVRASELRAANYNRTFPVSQPHPWRSKRASDPGFGKYYRDRYGAAESIPNGYFTSACSPLVYQDMALPGLSGQLLACAPAQNLVHRAVMGREGARLTLRRALGEAQSEFLASSDIWFHPIHLSIGPAGGVWLADFYREIIEDYSAIPRYLQQQYGLDAGRDHGRIWRLVHDDMVETSPPDMAGLDAAALARETASPHFWRRQTARRLLIQLSGQANDQVTAILKRNVEDADDVTKVINTLYTLQGLGRLSDEVVQSALGHHGPGVRRHALRLAEERFSKGSPLLVAALGLVNDPSPIVRLQLALSLGESNDPRTLVALARLANEHSDDDWLTGAILTSLAGRADDMLAVLLEKPAELGRALGLVGRLCDAVATRRSARELSGTILQVAQLEDRGLQRVCLDGLRKPFKTATSVALTGPARAALKKLSAADNSDVRVAALGLNRVLKLELASERRARIERALREAGDVKLSVDHRLAAVRGLASENDKDLAARLLDSYSAATPPLRRAILETAFARHDHLSALLTAMEQEKLSPATLNAVQRTALVRHPDSAFSNRAKALFSRMQPVDDAILKQFVSALKLDRDADKGQEVFSQHCAPCHRAHGIGFDVGPDLTGEFRRAEETIVHDILAPSDKIVAGHETYTIQTSDGRVLSGVLAGESAGSLTLSLAGGQRLDVLRKDIRSIQSLPVSLMPESLAQVLQPVDVANVIAWLRRPSTRMVLFDDDPAFVALLTDGGGTARIVNEEKHTGSASLRITPPQKYSARIKGWAFRIREIPSPGEYRYMRFAWKAPMAQGVMIELADNGGWPSPDSAHRRYYSGKNTTKWQATQVAQVSPVEWTVVTRDLWKDFGDLTLTGIAPTAMGGTVLFDRIELLRQVGK